MAEAGLVFQRHGLYYAYPMLIWLAPSRILDILKNQVVSSLVKMSTITAIRIIKTTDISVILLPSLFSIGLIALKSQASIFILF
jgi:hypothetical protein